MTSRKLAITDSPDGLTARSGLVPHGATVVVETADGQCVAVIVLPIPTLMALTEDAVEYTKLWKLDE